jgi:hypothetical protein
MGDGRWEMGDGRWETYQQFRDFTWAFLFRHFGAVTLAVGVCFRLVQVSRRATKVNFYKVFLILLLIFLKNLQVSIKILLNTANLKAE